MIFRSGFRILGFKDQGFKAYGYWGLGDFLSG